MESKKNMLKKIIKSVFPGVSWKHPVLNLAFKVVDPIDYLFRVRSGLPMLPPYSIRIRSLGTVKQFGGKRFHQFGRLLADILIKYASLNRHSIVLEIGCGCGRTCFALSKILDDGNYHGMDIEKTSLKSCQNNPIFIDKKFHFDYLNVQNDLYNTDGKYRADSYSFPFDQNEFDVIFLVSVFTHMLTDDVKNYIAEISRMLKPNGVCMITTYLMDHGTNSNGLCFPYSDKEHFFYKQDMPEVTIGYYLDFFTTQFALHGLKQVHDTLWGNWRNNQEVTSSSGYPQDILFFSKIDKII